MSELLSAKLEECAPSFSNVVIDLFRNYHVTRGWGKSVGKRYCVIFSCFVDRTVHIEIYYDLSMKMLINTFCRFTCRRGSVKFIHSNNGTNLRASRNEFGRVEPIYNTRSVRSSWCQVDFPSFWWFAVRRCV